MKQFIVFLAAIILTGCGSSKVKLFKAGDVKQQEFFKVISFETKGSLPIVTVEINGHKAKCLFDTGAPNVISPELAAKLNLKTVTSSYVRDSGGNKAKQDYVILDSVDMDGIVFRKMTAIIVDLSGNDALACIDIDGVIGANLMNKAYWEINYQKKNLTFTNNIAKLSDTSKMVKLNFNPAVTGTPKVDLKLNGYVVKNMTFDTGSNGDIVVPKRVVNQVPEFGPNKEYVSEIGSTSFGVHGMAKGDTNFFRLIDSLSIGEDLHFQSKIMEFRGSAKLIGSKFLENYSVILDWNSNKIYMNEEKTYRRDTLKSFGFDIYFKDRKIYIGSVFLNTDATDLLKIGDQILSINDDNFEDIDEEFYCPIILKKKRYDSYGDNLKMKIKRGEEVLDIKVSKKLLLK